MVEYAVDSKAKAKYKKTLEKYDNLFAGDETLRKRDIKNVHSGIRFRLYFFDGMVDSQFISLNVIRPLETTPINKHSDDLVNEIFHNAVSGNEISIPKDDNEIISSVEYGDSLLVCEAFDTLLVINTKGFITRGTQEPDLDKSLLGPREGFNECLMQNISLLKRKLLTNELKLKFWN